MLDILTYPLEIMTFLLIHFIFISDQIPRSFWIVYTYVGLLRSDTMLYYGFSTQIQLAMSGVVHVPYILVLNNLYF